MCNQNPILIDVSSKAQTAAPESFAESSRGNTTWHTLLSSPATSSTCMSSGVAVCPPYGTLALHRHKQSEIYYIIDGTGEVEIDGKRNKVSKDMVVWIPGDAEHGVFCGSESLKWLYVFPEGSFEKVVYRFSNEEEESKNVLAKL